MKKILALALALISIPSISSALTLDLIKAFAFQDEGYVWQGNKNLNGQVDVTDFLSSENDVYGTGVSVLNPYFATGTANSWLDAVALDFDLTSLGGDPISEATLMLKAKKGDYFRNDWEHYLVQAGLFNSLYEDGITTDGTDFNPAGEFLPFSLITNSPDGWYRIALNPALLGTNGDLTLRLWNISLDAVKLNVETRNPSPIPEPGSLLLLGTGLIGLAALRRKKRQ